MEFLDLCLKRESCRTYTGESITSSDLHQIVEVGRLAPSACNSQPWHFYVVSAGETLQGVKDGVKVLGTNKFTDKAGAFIVIAGAKENYTERVGQAIYGRDFSNIDIGITVANMALAATSLGLGTCIIGSFNEKKVKEALDITKTEKNPIKLVLAVGVPEKGDPRKKTRKPANEVVTFVD